jgi:A/G-specific adenine glycosylase
VLVDTVLAWWQGARAERDALPWRSTRDPWEILLAETMLAQTSVARAAQRYPDLVALFPTARDCARAAAGDVVRAWAGLGYNRRALGLHAAAGAIVERHEGAVPSTLDELLALPGVGPYTARAVLATAFGVGAAVVDTNVGRVLARAVAGHPLRRAEAQRIADGLVPAGRSRDWNLALMDFGSLVCRSRRPACPSCPLSSTCAWRNAPTRPDVAARASGRGDGATSSGERAPDPPGGGPDEGLSPDPAVGSAGVTARQSRFSGSDREGRGRIVRAACDGPVLPAQLGQITGWIADEGRARRVAAALVADGLLVEGPGGELRLP